MTIAPDVSVHVRPLSVDERAQLGISTAMDDDRAGLHDDEDATMAVVSPPPFDATWLDEEEEMKPNTPLWVDTRTSEEFAATNEPNETDLSNDADDTTVNKHTQAYLGSCTRGSGSSNEEDNASTGRVADSSKTRASVLKSSSRQAYAVKKKEEVTQLRATSVELQRTLDALLATNEARKSQMLRSGRGGRMLGGWRGVAFRQLQRRIQVEQTNRQLRTELRQCNDLVQQLVCSIQSSLSLMDTKRLSTVLVTSMEKEAMRFSEHDVRTIMSFANDLGGMHHQANAVLTECEEPILADDQFFNSAHVWHRDPDAGGDILELTETRVVPFNFDAAVRAIGRVMQEMSSGQSNPAVMHLPGGANAIKFCYKCVDGDSQPTEFECVFVGRVTVEEDRAVMCWRATSRRRGCLGTAADQFGETGWGVARRQTSASVDGEMTAGTMFSFCTRYGRHTPSLPMSESTRDSGLERFAELMTQSVEEESIEWFQTMERVVMDEGAGSQDGGRQVEAEEALPTC